MPVCGKLRVNQSAYGKWANIDSRVYLNKPLRLIVYDTLHTKRKIGRGSTTLVFAQ